MKAIRTENLSKIFDNEVNPLSWTPSRRMKRSGSGHPPWPRWHEGMKKRVYLTRTLLHRPEIIFLDEPTVGLDPEAVLHVTGLIRRLARENSTTIFLCTHNLFLAERICDTFGFISSGELVACGKKEELVNSNSREKKVEIKTLNGRFTFPYADEAEINGLISRLQNQGDSICEVKPLRPSLEQV